MASSAAPGDFQSSRRVVTSWGWGGAPESQGNVAGCTISTQALSESKAQVTNTLYIMGYLVKSYELNLKNQIIWIH